MTNFFIFVSHFFHALVIYDLRHGDSFANQFKSVKICNFRTLFQRVLQNAELAQGTYNEQFSVKDLSGVYLLNVKIGDEQQTFRLVIQ